MGKSVIHNRACCLGFARLSCLAMYCLTLSNPWFTVASVPAANSSRSPCTGQDNAVKCHGYLSLVIRCSCTWHDTVTNSDMKASQHAFGLQDHMCKYQSTESKQMVCYSCSCHVTNMPQRIRADMQTTMPATPATSSSKHPTGRVFDTATNDRCHGSAATDLLSLACCHDILNLLT